jgi:hypothetical protein
LPSHFYHVSVDEFDFGSSPTADVLKHRGSNVSVGRQHLGDPGVLLLARDAVSASSRRDLLY